MGKPATHKSPNTVRADPAIGSIGQAKALRQECLALGLHPPSLQVLVQVPGEFARQRGHSTACAHQLNDGQIG